MTKVTLEVPEEVVEAVKLPPAEMESEFRKELAVAPYRRGVLPLGKARILAKMPRRQFEKMLADRQIPRHYSAADLTEDLQHGQESGPVNLNVFCAHSEDEVRPKA